LQIVYSNQCQLIFISPQGRGVCSDTKWPMPIWDNSGH